MKNDIDQNMFSQSALALPSDASSHSLATVELDLMSAAGIPATVSLHSLRPSMGSVQHVCLSDDGSLLAVASKAFVFLFETCRWETVGVLQGHGDIVTRTCLSANQAILVSGSLDGSLRIWDLARQETMRIIRPGSPITCLHASPDCKKVVAGCNNGLVIIVDVDTGTSNELNHDKPVTDVFLYQHKWLTTETDDCVCFWDLDKGLMLRRYDFPIDKGEPALLELPKLYMSVNEGNRAVLVYMITGAPVRQFRHSEGHINCVHMTSDARFLATAGTDSEARLWGRNGDLLGIFPHRDPVTSVQISEDSRYLITGSEDMTVGVWKLSGERIKTLESEIQSVITTLLLPDGLHLVVGSYKGAAVYNLETGHREYSLGPRDYWSGMLSVDAGGQRLAASFRDGSVYIWDLEERRPLAILKQAGKKFYAVGINPDGKRCFTGSEEGDIVAWDLDKDTTKPRTAQEFPPVHTEWVRSIAVSHDGGLVASGSWDGRVILWWPDGSIKAHCIGGQRGVYSVAFNPSGSFLACGDRDGMVWIWDTEGSHRLTIQTNQDQVKQVFFTRENGLLTAGFDGSAKLWDIGTGQCLQIFQGGHVHPWVRSAIISADGGRVITGGKDGTVCFWRQDDGVLLAKLHQLSSGFLWTTPPEPHVPSGWVWTNRTDMLEVQEKEDSDSRQAHAVIGPKRQTYLAAYNNRIKIVSRLRDSSSHKEDHFSRLLDLKRTGLNERYEPKRLTFNNQDCDRQNQTV